MTSLKKTLILCAAVLLPCSAYAGEIRILDPHGLTRIIEQIKTAEVTVLVHLAAPTPEGGISLTNVSGLSSDIPGIPVDDHTVQFTTVPEGIWRIQSHTGSVAVSKVEVQ